MVGSAQSRWASAATTSSALRGACCHSTSITTASASLIGVMVYIRNRRSDYARNRLGCQVPRLRVHPGCASIGSSHPWHRMKALPRSEEHTSELQSQSNLVCRLLLEKKKK